MWGTVESKLKLFSFFFKLNNIYNLCTICLFMEEGALCLIGAAYPGSGTPMFQETFLKFKNSLSIVISGQMLRVHNLLFVFSCGVYLKC